MELPRWPKDRVLIESFAEFDPAKVAGFPPSAPLTIRSIAVFAAASTADSRTLAYFGTGGGKIILVALNPPTSGLDSPEKVEFLRSASVGNRPIESIHVLWEIERVIVESDGLLFLLDLLLATPARKLGFAKDVVAVSKRVPCTDQSGLGLLSDGTYKAEILRPGQTFLQKLSGGIRSNGVNSRLVEPQRGGISCFLAVAAAKRLVLLEFTVAGTTDASSDSGNVSVLFKEMQGIDGIKAMSWVGDSIILGTSDGYSLVSVPDGSITPLFTLPESSGPPLLKSLWRSREVLMLVDNVGVIVNSAGQPAGGSLIFQNVPKSVAEMSSYIIVARDGRMDLIRRKTGACVQSVSFVKDSFSRCMLANDDQGCGEVLVIATPYEAICFHKMPPEEQIKNLLRKKNFNEAISLLEEFESEGEMSNEMLAFVHAQIGFLLLFDLHFEDAVNHFLLSEAMQPSEIFPFIMRDPNRWSHLVPRNRYWGLHPPPVPLEQVIDDGLMAIQRALFLKKAGIETASDEDFLLNPPNRSDLLDLAIKSIIRYLNASRDKDLDLPVKEGVDTLLMYLYRALNLVDHMERLASSENNCVIEELETLLDDSGHLRTLAFLYASKGMCSKALSIWRILAKNYSTGFWKESASLANNSPEDNGTVSYSSWQTAALEASKLLQESSDEDLILEHLGWIADIDEELAVLVLTSEKRVNQLSPEKVLSVIDPRKIEIHHRFLQWLIEDQESEDSRFHTLYALSLARTAVETSEMGGDNGKTNDIRQPELIVTDGQINNSHTCSVRNRLQMFLEASDMYDPEEVLDVIEESELWLEKAILYRKMGQETMVLQILALKLEDSDAAERYCTEIGRDDAYMQLLDLYLDPKDGKEPMFKAAVRLVHNHGISLDPLQVLEKLSPEMPLQLASDTIVRMLKARVHHYRQAQIVNSLSRAMNLDARLSRYEERSRNVQINDESTCDSCHSRLGTKLFAMYPDDSIVCYKCYRRLGESTSPHGRNFKQDAIFKSGWLVTR